MKFFKIKYCVVFLLLCFSVGFSGTKLLILPLHYSEETNYSSGIYKSTEAVIFNSLYGFIGYLPMVDIPMKEELIKMSWDESKIEGIGLSHNAEYVVYGDFSLEGDRRNADIVLNVNVWSKSKNGVIFTQKYRGKTGLDLFDTIDKMINDLVYAMFYLKAEFAEIRIGGFQISENDRYSVFLSGKKLVEITNKDYAGRFNILANREYRLYIIRERDNALVGMYNIELNPDSFTNISYTGKGDIKVMGIKNGVPGVKYTLMVDGKEVKKGEFLSNLNVSDAHDYVVLERNNILKQGVISLRDGETYKLLVDLYGGKNLFFNVYGLGGQLVGLNILYFPWIKMWCGIGTGVTPLLPFYVNFLKQDEFLIQQAFNLEAGYYFYGGLNTDLRAGIGLKGFYYLFYPTDVAAGYGFSDGYGGSVFLSIGFKFIRANVLATYDIVKNRFSPNFEIGISF